MTLEISVVKDKRFTGGEHWFVDKHDGKALVGIFSSRSKSECLEFMRKYRANNA